MPRLNQLHGLALKIITARTELSALVQDLDMIAVQFEYLIEARIRYYTVRCNIFCMESLDTVLAVQIMSLVPHF